MFKLDRTDVFQARAADQLQRETIGWLTTVSPGGMPQPSPVWFIWDGSDAIILYSKPDAPKIRSIAANPRVTFHFDSGARGEMITIFSGTAAIDPATPGVETYPGYAEKYHADFLITGSSPAKMAAEYTTPIMITIDKLRGY